MKLNGWVRLWIVVTVIGVPIAAELEFQQTAKFWDNLTEAHIKSCVDAAWDRPDHPDAIKCEQANGDYKTVFQHENTSPARYWSELMGEFLIFDIFVTALLAAAFWACRWVIRGFK